MVRGIYNLEEGMTLHRVVREDFMEERCLDWVSEDELEFSR